jgi:hypothetical protein
VTANGFVLGGVVRLQGGQAVTNEGTISANGGTDGGVVVAKAGTLALNGQDINASGEAGRGGFIRFHGNSLAVNGLSLGESNVENAVASFASLNANGGTNGGVIQLTSAGGPVLDPTGTNLTALLGQAGFGITQGVLRQGAASNSSLVNALTLPGGTAANLGVLNAFGAEAADGAIDVAGDGLAFLGANSSVNGIAPGNTPATFFANANAVNVRLVAGTGAVKAVACGGPIPVNPVPPFSTPPVLVPTKNEPKPSFTFNGLNNNQRPQLLDKFPQVSHNKLILRLGRPGLFLAKAYTPVTQEILTLALREYNREITLGKTPNEALRLTQLYLEQAGVDSEIATQLVEQINGGAYTADSKVVAVLKTMATQTLPAQPAATPTEVEPVRQ